MPKLEELRLHFKFVYEYNVINITAVLLQVLQYIFCHFTGSQNSLKNSFLRNLKTEKEEKKKKKSPSHMQSQTYVCDCMCEGDFFSFFFF